MEPENPAAEGSAMNTDTKQMIADTLFALLEHESIDRVTVKALVGACGISRQTFYYHFRDIMDVLEWGIRQALERDLRRSLEAQDLPSAIGVLVEQTACRQRPLRMLLNSQRRADFERLLVQAIRTHLGELLRRRFPRARLPAADAAALLDFCACGVLGLLLGRSGREDTDPEVLADQLCRLLSGELQRQLL